MNFLRKYAARHQLMNPGAVAVRLYDSLSRFSRKVSLSDYAVPPAVQTLRGKTILVAMFRASITSNFLDLLLYRELKARGAEVKVVLCDGETFPCDNIAGISNIFNYRCLQCKAVQERFKEQIEPSDLLYVHPINSAILAVPPSINAVASAKRFDMSEDYDNELALRYQRTYLSVIQLLSAQPHIDMIIMSHGLYATWGAFRDYCKDHGINYITWGRTYFNKMLGVVKNSAFNEGPGTYDQATIKRISHEPEFATLLESLDARIKGGPGKSDTVNYYAYLDETGVADALGDITQLSVGKPIIAVYLSIPWDGTVYGSNGEFQSQRDLINSIVAMARINQELFFVFRIHPREAEMPEKAAIHIEEALGDDNLPNLTIVEAQARLTSYNLAQTASLNILYSGTLAIEFAYAGFPLIVCGKNLVFGIDSIAVIDTVAKLDEAVRTKNYRQYKPDKQCVIDGLRKISAVLYDDDLTVSENYEVKSINPNSGLVRRIIKELVE